jgi:hypothetical protein
MSLLKLMESRVCPEIHSGVAAKRRSPAFRNRHLLRRRRARACALRRLRNDADKNRIRRKRFLSLPLARLSPRRAQGKMANSN